VIVYPIPPSLKATSMHTMPMKKEQVFHITHANPMLQFDKVLKPQLPHRAVDTQPFNFEEW